MYIKPSAVIDDPFAPQLLRLPDVQAMTALSRSTIYALVAAGKFPRPIRLTERAVRWMSTEVETWIHEAASGTQNRTPSHHS